MLRNNCHYTTYYVALFCKLSYKKQELVMKNKHNQDQIKMTKSSVIKDDSYYFNMKDPKSGSRYDIPMLSRIDPEYYFKYIYFMKLKERSPDTFEKILRWD